MDNNMVDNTDNMAVDVDNNMVDNTDNMAVDVDSNMVGNTDNMVLVSALDMGNGYMVVFHPQGLQTQVVLQN
ncbi:hypothetical protein [Priestia megaterium]|uniref:hypothetical protein n=1 Tax=Priestia megaterium TaxID=1404 RepID=UPI00192A41C5|nr:hypothetical protein [Priestia megaterium]